MAVENEGQSAATGTEVENNGAGASSANDGVDLALALAEALEREESEKALRVKAESDRDNYKLGLLKAKGKTATGGTEGTEIISPEATSAIEKLLLRNKELETAAANRSQTSSGGQGASTETTMTVGDNMLSAAQVQDLKARGKSDEWIARFKANLQKAGR